MYDSTDNETVCQLGAPAGDVAIVTLCVPLQCSMNGNAITDVTAGNEYFVLQAIKVI